MRQQGGRYLDEVHATLVTGGSEPGHVANHSAAQGDHGGAAVMARSQQAVKNALQGFPVLEGFAVGQHHGNYRELGQAASQALQVQRGNGLVGDDCHLPSGDVRRQQLGLIQQPFANMDRVATLA